MHLSVLNSCLPQSTLACMLNTSSLLLLTIYLCLCVILFKGSSEILNRFMSWIMSYDISVSLLYCFSAQNMLPAATAAKSLQSCPTLCNPIDGSPPSSPVPGILQARTLEWVAISFSNA